MIFATIKEHWRFEPTDEQKQLIIDQWPGYAPNWYDKDKFAVPSTPARMTWEEAQAWTEAGIRLDIEPCKSMMAVKMKDMHGRDEGDGTAAFMSGRLFNVTLPDVGLLLIDEVTWLDDACTQELQRHLDQGWRILAVCPPNAQRRPDYILGRRKEKAA